MDRRVHPRRLPVETVSPMCAESVPIGDPEPSASVRGSARGPTTPGSTRSCSRDGDRRNVVDGYRYWRSRRSSPTSTRVGTRSTWPSRTSPTTSTSGRSCAPPTRSSPPRCTSSGGARWNRRGAMVTDRYQHVRHHDSVAELAAWADGGGLAAARDRQPAGRGPARDLRPPRALRPAVRAGRAGPVTEAREVCPVVLSIAQYGSTRSVNAGAAAAIAMHAWVRRHVFDQVPPPDSR